MSDGAWGFWVLVANHVEVYSVTVDPVGTDPFQLLIVFLLTEVST